MPQLYDEVVLAPADYDRMEWVEPQRRAREGFDVVVQFRRAPYAMPRGVALLITRGRGVTVINLRGH